MDNVWFITKQRLSSLRYIYDNLQLVDMCLKEGKGIVDEFKKKHGKSNEEFRNLITVLNLGLCKFKEGKTSGYDNYELTELGRNSIPSFSEFLDNCKYWNIKYTIPHESKESNSKRVNVVDFLNKLINEVGPVTKDEFQKIVIKHDDVTTASNEIKCIRMNEGIDELEIAYKDDRTYKLICLMSSVTDLIVDDDVILSSNMMISMRENINNNYLQNIYSGAPGTGKSYYINTEILNNVSELFYERVTFYEEYDYYNFIGSILPDTNSDNKILYKFKPGPFTKILKKAVLDKENTYYLVIEEMTRGDAASIFGDIFQLLDRDCFGNSEYSITNESIAKYIYSDKNKKISIPSNLSILGTINTSDQNVNILDTAFKRRFNIEYIDVNKNIEGISDDIVVWGYKWKDLYMCINNFLINNLNIDEDRLIGPFFIKSNIEVNKLISYLWTDVIGYNNNRAVLFNENIKYLGQAIKSESSIELFSREFIKFIEDNNVNKII